MRVLIVDDNADDRRLLRYNLERHGCETVIEARDGQEGFDLAGAHRPDLIISDALMPRVDGFQFLRMVKMDEELKAIPFVFHSAVYTGLNDEELAFRLGAQAFIPKPKEPEEFWTEIAAVLKNLGADKMEAPSSEPMEEEKEYLRKYSGIVAAKLETKVRELEESLGRRKEAEEKLRESECRYRRITECLTDYLYSVRVENGRAVETTQGPACATVTGYTPEELDADPYLWIRMVAPEDRELVRERVRQVLAGTDIAPLEHRIIRKDGAERWVCDTTITLKDASGQLLSYDGVVKDITEQKRAEAEIRTLNQDLEQRVVERTAQLASANQELEAFAYSVSHDLHAPLRHIDGFVELLQKREGESPDECSRHYMEMISDAVRRMSRLIDDLLSFSRMGRAEMSRRQVDLGALVQEVIGELEPETRGRSIRWHVAELPTVTGDRAMLRVVLVNLISNAVKFTRSCRTAEIEVGSTAGGVESESVVFVRDNGVGFDPACEDKLFGVFQRLHHPEEFEGTGIGLANVRRIIARHGGRTWAEGQVNCGATFYFSLPARDPTKRGARWSR